VHPLHPMAMPMVKVVGAKKACVCPILALNFECADRECSFLLCRYILNIWVSFMYQGYQVKVKVTGAESVSVFPVHGGLFYIKNR